MCSIIGGYNINHIKTDYKDFINNSFELMRHRGPERSSAYDAGTA